MLNKRAIYLILATICFLVYLNSLNNAFISDDIVVIVNNPDISHPLNFWLSPPSFLSSLNYLICGNNPFIYHLTNIILHSLVTMMVFFFLSSCFKSEPSFLAAALFAVHPIHTEAVTWISGRPYIVLTLFVLTTYFLYSYATDKERFKPVPYLFSLLIFSYYIMRNLSFYFIFPFLLILSDITFKRARKTWKYWLLFLGVVIVRLFLAQSLILRRISDLKSDVGISPVKNPIVFFLYSLFAHLSLLIWPARLTFYHEPAIASAALLNYSIFYLIPIIFLLYFTFKRAKEVFFGIGIFILFLAPTYSPIPVAALIAERYIYLPSIALSIWLAFLYERCVGKSPALRRHLLALFILLIIGYGVRTVFRNEDWKTPARFWRRTLEVSPHSARAHNNMGFTYFEERNFSKAIEECKKAIEINPIGALPYYNLGCLYRYLGDKTKAAASFSKAIELNPSHINSYNNLGGLYISIGKNKEAIALLKKALEIDLAYYHAHINLCIAYFNEKQYGLAIKHCDEAVRLGYKTPPNLSEALKPYRKK